MEAIPFSNQEAVEAKLQGHFMFKYPDGSIDGDIKLFTQSVTEAELEHFLLVDKPVLIVAFSMFMRGRLSAYKEQADTIFRRGLKGPSDED